MELSLIGLRNANEKLEREVEELQMANRETMRSLRKDKAAELTAFKQQQSKQWTKLLQDSNSRIQQDYQRQLLSQRQKFDREMKFELTRLRTIHQAELRAVNIEHYKTQHFLQQQIKEIKESNWQKNCDDKYEKIVAEKERTLKENKILRDEKRHLEEVIERLTESEKERISEIRKVNQLHQMQLCKIKKRTKQEGLQMLQSLKAKDRLIESLKEELGKENRKRKRCKERESVCEEGGGMFSRAQKIPKKAHHEVKAEIMSKKPMDSCTSVPVLMDKNVSHEEEFSSLTSQDSGITATAPSTPTADEQDLLASNDGYSRLLKEHEVLQRSYQLLRLYILKNTQAHNKTQHDQTLNNMGNCQQKENVEDEEQIQEEQPPTQQQPEPPKEEEEEKETQKLEVEIVVEPEQQELDQLKNLLELSNKELQELREQNELMEFRVLELETKQPCGKSCDVEECGVDTNDLWDSSLIVTEHMNQLDVFLHSEAEPSEKADAVQEWLDEALSEAWITPVCQQSLVRITNVLRMLQTRLAEAESEVIQGPRYCGSLETIIEEKEEPLKDNRFTQTDVDLLTQKLVRQLEDELAEARHQLLALNHENASLHEQLSNIHEQRTNISATESELAHLAPSITGSDLSDCDDMRTHVEGPYDSIDSVPDKLRMERDMVIQDFQESGIFEGDEDMKSITGKSFSSYQTDSSFDSVLMSSDKKLSKELEAKTKELERAQGDVRQLEHCMDCLRLQLDGGTPCYPLGKGFTDILDKVRKLQVDLDSTNNKKLKVEEEADLLRESQRDIAEQLDMTRREKVQVEQKCREKEEELDTAKLELQRSHSKDSCDVEALKSELEWTRDRLRENVIAMAALSLWGHTRQKTLLALPNCDTIKDIPTLNGHSATEVVDACVMTEYQCQDIENYYTTQIQMLEKQKCQLKKQIECHTDQYQILKENLQDETTRYLVQLKLLEEDLQKEKDASLKSHKEYRHLQKEVNEQKKRGSELQNTINNLKQELEISDESDVLDKVRTLMHVETTLRQKVIELEKKESAYRETLQEADKIMASVESKYCDRIIEVEKGEENLRNQLRISEQNEQRLRQALRAATKGGELFKVPDLLEKLIDTEGSELKLREQVHRLEKEENSLRMKARETERVAAELKEELQDQEEMLCQMNYLQKQNSLMQSEISSLRTQAKQIEELEETMKFFKARVEELEESEISLKRRLEQQHNCHEGMQAQLEQELSSCKEELERSLASQHMSSKTNDGLNKELAQVKEKLAQAEKEIQQKLNENEDCESSSRHEISKLRHQLVFANDQLSELEGLNCTIREQLTHTEKKVGELNSEICELKHVHEKSLLQLNLQLIHKDNEMHQQEEKQLQLDGKELDALSQQESELKNVELRLRNLRQDLQKCCECSVMVAPVLESVTDDLRLLLTLICGEAASQLNVTCSDKNIDELESSCEDLVSGLIEDEVPITQPQNHPNPMLKRVASLEETLRQWELEGDLLQAQLEQREAQVKEQGEEINRQQSVIEHLRGKTIELYQKIDDQSKDFSTVLQDLQNRCSHKNIIISVLASEAAATSGNIRHLIAKLDSVEKGTQVEDFNLELVKQYIQQWQTKSDQESCASNSSSRTSSLTRRKSLCDLLSQVNWDSIRASSETSLLPPGSSPSKIPRYMPLHAKEVEVEKANKGVVKKKRISLSSIHRSKQVNEDFVENREPSPLRQEYRERSPLESSNAQLQAPQDFRITRKVGEDSLLLAWTSVKDENVAGYQILVNGIVAQHVRSPNRNKALLPGLVLNRGLHLAIRALAVPKGNRSAIAGPPYAIRYDPRIQYNLPSDCHSIQTLRHPVPQLVFETEC